MKELLRASLERAPSRSRPGVERILATKSEPINALADLASVWDLPGFGLDQVQIVRAADPERQLALCRSLASQRLLEAWQIEKAGMSFAAKMSLLAESLSEQRLYVLFGAEEASHFHAIDQMLAQPAPEAADPFIELLREIIVSAERRPLQLLIQVVLEGWGIEHYALMARSCLDPALKLVLGRILADEAGHHGSGLSLFQAAELSPAESDYIVTTLRQFLKLVAIGPVGMLATIETEIAPLSTRARHEVLEQLDARAETAAKLKLLAGYLRKAGAEQILERLERDEAFTPSF